MNRNDKKFSHHPYRPNRQSSNWSNNNNNDDDSNKKLDKYRIFNNSEASLYIFPLFKYEENFPPFQTPQEIGTIISDKRKLHLEARKKNLNSENKEKLTDLEKANGVRFLVLPKEDLVFNFDLKLGLSEFVPHIPHQNGIDNLLKWILENKSCISSKQNPNKLFKLDFVCWRGLLTKAMATPYDKQKDWMFSIILFKGTYYLCEIETDKEKDQRINMDEKTKSFTYWGHKFESYVTTDLPDDEPNGVDDVPDPENNYGSIIKSKLDKFDLLYAAEIDCCMNKEHKELSDYCELKTCRGQSFEDLNLQRNMKYLKWWLQSYLVDIKVIKIGMRNDDGIVNKIIECTTRDIYFANNNRKWKPNVCFNFLKYLLDLISNFCTEENTVYIALKEFDSNQVKISKSSTQEHNILRDWFISSLQ